MIMRLDYRDIKEVDKQLGKIIKNHKARIKHKTLDIKPKELYL